MKKIIQILKFFWQKEVINSLVFDELKNSLLHISVINDWQKLVTYLINKWLIDIDYKDNSGNSALNHACLLLQKESTLTIKNYDQLTIENKMFLKIFLVYHQIEIKIKNKKSTKWLMKLEEKYLSIT